jgi:hypothetical protein
MEANSVSHIFASQGEKTSDTELYAGVSKAILQGSPGDCGRGDRRVAMTTVRESRLFQRPQVGL